jgi:hypothetical protein
MGHYTLALLILPILAGCAREAPPAAPPAAPPVQLVYQDSDVQLWHDPATGIDYQTAPCDRAHFCVRPDELPKCTEAEDGFATSVQEAPAARRVSVICLHGRWWVR